MSTERWESYPYNQGKSSIAKDLAKAIAKERRAKQKVKGKLSFGQSNREGKPSGKTAVPEPKARERWERLLSLSLKP